MAGGGHLFIKILIPSQCKISSNPFISSVKNNGGQGCIPYGRWGCCLLRFCYRVNAKNHPIPLLAVEVPLQTWIHCSPYERWVNLRSSYTHSRGKFSYDIDNLYSKPPDGITGFSGVTSGYPQKFPRSRFFARGCQIMERDSVQDHEIVQVGIQKIE